MMPCLAVHGRSQPATGRGDAVPPAPPRRCGTPLARIEYRTIRVPKRPSGPCAALPAPLSVPAPKAPS